MKKILLLLMAMFTFANCSFAENWVLYETSKETLSYIDMDSFRVNKNCINYKHKIMMIPVGDYIIMDATFNVDSNELTLVSKIYDYHNVLTRDNIVPRNKVIDESPTTILLKKFYKNHKELLARNIVIVFEIIAILFLLMYIKKKQKEVKVVITEEKDNVEEHENN